MKENEAKRYFHGVEGYNCAQAVLKAFQQEFNISELKIKQARINGGGMASGGVCGALNSAKSLTNNKKEADQIENEFKEFTGSTKCMEILRGRRRSCLDCVAKAAELLEKSI